MILTQEQRDEANRPHAEIANFWAKNPPEPDNDDLTVPDPMPIQEGMAIMEAEMLHELGPAPNGVEEIYHDISMRDGFQSTLKVVKPTNGEPGPLVIQLFGGGFIGGSKDQMTRQARTIAELYGATVVNISYRLAPQYKFPYAQHDAWDSCIWIASNATTPLINSDPRKGFILGGVSAGGAIVASLSRQFQETPLAYPLTGQSLIIPTLMDADSCPAAYRHLYSSPSDVATVPGIGMAKIIIQCMAQWTQADPKSPLRHAPLSKTDIAGQPRTYFQIDGLDPLRDDGLIYEEMLKAAGVETRLDFYPGCPHAHWMSFPELAISKQAKIDCTMGYGWLLNREVSREKIDSVLT